MIKPIVIAALFMSGQAFAQYNSTTTPNGIGGWNTTYTAPNGHIGGYSTTTPNGIGGYNTTITAPNGHIIGNSTTMPNGIGGWNTNGR